MPAQIQDHWKRIGKLRVFERKFQRKCRKGIWVCSDDKTVATMEPNELGLLTIDLYEEGYLVESSICTWSKIKKYSLPVDEALQDCISPRINSLKNKGAKNAVSQFILVDGGHGDVRENGKEKILEWLKGI